MIMMNDFHNLMVNSENKSIESDDSFFDDDIEMVRTEFLSDINEPAISFNNCHFYINMVCINKMPDVRYVQLLINKTKNQIKYPVFINEVLYEIIKISIDNVIAIAKKQDDEANIIINNILQNKKVVESDKLPKRESGKKRNKRTVLPDITQCSVKDMPAFDPDSYVSSLILTIPSWISSIERTAENSNIETISLKAKYDLADSLEKLISISSIIKNILEEE